MPIKGLTGVMRPVRAGKFRLGEKKLSQRGKEHPSKIDYFLCDPEEGYEQLAEEVEAKYGAQPRRLNICFASDDADEVFQQNYDLYSASGLLCRGDGETAQRVDPNKPGELCEVRCLGPAECPFSIQRGVHGRPGCKRHAVLRFMLRDVKTLGIWQIDTTSIYSILNINTQIATLRALCGRISMVPVELVIQPMQVKNPEDGKRVTIYVLKLDVPVALEQIHTLKPLTASIGTLPPPIERAPDDLYPRSQLAAPVAALAAPVQDGPDIIDPDTGEVLNADDAGEGPVEPIAETESAALPLEQDADVAAAMAHMSPARRQALMRAAGQFHWTKAQLLDKCADAPAVEAEAMPRPRAAANPGVLF